MYMRTVSQLILTITVYIWLMRKVHQVMWLTSWLSWSLAVSLQRTDVIFSSRVSMKSSSIFITSTTNLNQQTAQDPQPVSTKLHSKKNLLVPKEQSSVQTCDVISLTHERYLCRWAWTGRLVRPRGFISLCLRLFWSFRRSCRWSQNLCNMWNLWAAGPETTGSDITEYYTAVSPAHFSWEESRNISVW